MSRTWRVETRLTVDEYRSLEAICCIRGVQRSSYLRGLIQADIKRALERQDIIDKMSGR